MWDDNLVMLEPGSAVPITEMPLFTDEEKAFLLEALETAFDEKRDWKHKRSLYAAVNVDTGEYSETVEPTKWWRKAQRELEAFKQMKSSVEQKLATVTYVVGMDVQVN